MNIVLIIAWVLALISAIAVPPDSAYLSYIDFHTLGLLFLPDGSDGRRKSSRHISAVSR